jgi:predicted enzyme related to lactoylglutathione lyase
VARPVHFEVQASDPQRAMDFYSKIFGWQFSEYIPGVYWSIITGDEGTPGINGGLVTRPAAVPPRESGTNAYVCTLDVENVDEVIAAVEKAGGEIALPKQVVPAVGWLVYFIDPEGNTFGAMQQDPSAM